MELMAAVIGLEALKVEPCKGNDLYRFEVCGRFGGKKMGIKWVKTILKGKKTAISGKGF